MSTVKIKFVSLTLKLLVFLLLYIETHSLMSYKKEYGEGVIQHVHKHIHMWLAQSGILLATLGIWARALGDLGLTTCNYDYSETHNHIF